MVRTIKWMAPVVALGLLVGLGAAAQAQDAAAAAGTITGTVTGVDGKPAANAQVRLMAPPSQKEAKADENASDKPKGKGKGPAPVATGQTDENGKFELTGVAAGDYVVAAGIKGVGMGRQKVTVKAGETATVDIKMKEAGEKKAGEDQSEDKPKKKGKKQQ